MGAAIQKRGPLATQCVEPFFQRAEHLAQRALEPLGPPARRAAELALLVDGALPAPALPAARDLLGAAQDLRRRTENAEADLAFRDWSVLGLDTGRAARAWRERKDAVFDGVRKVDVRTGTPLRRCVLCGTAMEDASPKNPKMALLLNLTRTCFCGGQWVAEKPAGRNGGPV